MSHRFFLSQTPTEDTARLEGDEARHLARVMRAKTGDTVELFDGQGTSWPATVVSIRTQSRRSEYWAQALRKVTRQASTHPRRGPTKG